jgi:hypothetical protein
MDAAARKLGIAKLQVAKIEKTTRRIPACARRAMTAALNPPSPYVQLSLWDYLAELDGGRGVHG